MKQGIAVVISLLFAFFASFAVKFFVFSHKGSLNNLVFRSYSRHRKKFTNPFLLKKIL